MLVDQLLNQLLAVVGTRVDAMVGECHVWQFPGASDDFFNVDHRGDVAAAMANEHAHSGRLVGNIAHRRIGLPSDLGSARRGQEFHGPTGRGTGLHDRVGDVLGFLERPADEHTRPRSVQRHEFFGVGKSPTVQLDPQHLSLSLQRGAGFQSQREDHHVELFFDLLDPFVRIDQLQTLRVGHFVSARDKRSDVVHAQLLRPLAIAIEILAERPQVEEEDRHVDVRLVLLDQDGFLSGGHAADRRAVVVPTARVARADALDKGQPLGLLPVGRPHDVPGGRSRGREDSLELHVRDHVFGMAKPELAASLGIEGLEAGRKYHGPDVQLDRLFLLFVADGPRLADLGTQPALSGLQMHAVIRVDHRHAGRSLRVGQVDGWSGIETLVVGRQMGPQRRRSDLRQIDGAGRTDDLASSAPLTLVGQLVECGSNLPRGATAEHADRAAVHQVVADPNAQPAKDTLSLLFGLKRRGVHTEFGGQAGQFG